jgi:tetratricopeptide (TPR) repeat protein
MKGIVLRIASLFVACVVPIVAGRAYSAEPPPEAKRHADACVRAYDLAEYERAIKECKSAYEIYPAALLLFSIGQAYRKLGDNEKALAFYRSYLAKAPNGSQRKVAEDQVAQLTALIESAERTRNAPPDSVMPSDSTTTERASSPTNDRAPHRALNGTPTAQSAEGGLRSAPTERWYRRPLAIGGFALVGVGVLTAATGGGLLGAANSSISQANQAATLDEKRSLEDQGTSFRVGGYAALGVGAAVVIGGATMVGIAAKRRRDPSIHVSFYSDPSNAFVSVRGALW